MTSPVRILIFATLTTLAAALVAGGQIDGARRGPLRFNRDIRPILSDNCFKCHGPDSGTRKAGLRLDREADAKAPRSGGPAIAPGSPDKSLLIARITEPNPARRMPPPGSGKQLTSEQIALLRRWVAEGARWEGHWSYLPIRKPPVPSVQNPPLRIRNPIDSFILARLRREGVSPSPEADRRTLIRRVTLDLTGLPPTPDEVRSFLSDRSDTAYEKVVDRLLASPRYGERMAQYWLDLVRYADTVGYHGDQDFTVWPYRDYVIRAFNGDKPFDQFTREQIAGDLIPGAGPEQKVASGYNRLGMMSAEGGVQDKEYLAKYAAERVRNVSTVWLGATMACAECHDHKFDPYTQKDFYRLAAFFADLNERGFYAGGYSEGDWGPTLRLPDEAQKKELERLDSAIAEQKAALAGISDDSLAEARAQWEAEVKRLDAASKLGWSAVKPLESRSAGGTILTVEGESDLMPGGPLPAFDTYFVTIPASLERISALKLEVLPDGRMPGNYVARAGYYFVLSEIEADLIEPGSPPKPARFAGISVNTQSEGFPGWAAIDGKADTGWARIHGGGGLHTAVLTLAEPLEGGPEKRLVIRLRQETAPHHLLGKFRISVCSLENPDSSAKGVPDNVLAALRKTPEQRSAEDQRLIASYYRGVAPRLSKERTELARLEGERSVLLGRIPRTLVSESVKPRVIRVLPRGNWMDESGEVASPGVPHFLPQPPESGRATRLDLADWLVSPENPLTARVLVNRMWRLFFGVGLARSVDDFGAQSEPPAHPELLDWLASELLEPAFRAPEAEAPSKWSLKRIVRLMVTSSVYRQSSKARADLAVKDPFNRLYARQTPQRLDAEFIRDTALAAAGMLDSRIGGPSVRPYQPPGYLSALNFPRREWAADAGADLYRRGLYTHWQRTFLHPSLLAFDAPTREEATCARTVSNTPMQALTLMNDPIFVEASRVLAERILREGGEGFENRLAFAFSRVLSRPPTPREAETLRGLHDSQRARYSADPESAASVVSAGSWPVPEDLDRAELAAWTAVGRALLNLHETVTRS